MNKICCIFNIAPHYREAIYKEMEKELEADFYFGDRMNFSIRKMDARILKNYRAELRNVFFRQPFYWQKGALRLLFKPYSGYLMSGETGCLSTWAMLALSRLSGKKIYLWSHGWYGNEGAVKQLIKRMWLNLSAGMFLYGEYAKEAAEKTGCRGKKLHVLYNSLDYDRHLELREKVAESPVYRHHFQNDNRNLLFTGRLIASKKLDILLAVAAELGKTGLQPNLVLIGDGPERAGLEGLARKLGIESQVWFYGACYDEEVLGNLIYNADLCVSPGSIGLTAIHSLSFGTPVITHNCFPEQWPEFEAISDGKTGCFFEYGKPESLALSIRKWLERPRDRNELRKQCYDVIDRRYNPHFQVEVLKKQLNPKTC